MVRTYNNGPRPIFRVLRHINDVRHPNSRCRTRGVREGVQRHGALHRVRLRPGHPRKQMRQVLFNAQQGHIAMQEVWQYCKAQLTAGKRVVLEAKLETRNLEQNAKMWATLADISEQVDWYGKKLTPKEWKCVLSASLKKQSVVPGIDGGFVVLGQSTSKMTIAEMSEMIELAIAFGAQQGVIFNGES